VVLLTQVGLWTPAWEHAYSLENWSRPPRSQWWTTLPPTGRFVVLSSGLDCPRNWRIYECHNLQEDRIRNTLHQFAYTQSNVFVALEGTGRDARDGQTAMIRKCDASRVSYPLRRGDRDISKSNSVVVVSRRAWLQGTGGHFHVVHPGGDYVAAKVGRRDFVASDPHSIQRYFGQLRRRSRI